MVEVSNAAYKEKTKKKDILVVATKTFLAQVSALASKVCCRRAVIARPKDVHATPPIFSFSPRGNLSRMPTAMVATRLPKRSAQASGLKIFR